ncbi:MAG: LysM peptidoglycan-binding domain-containing protein [Sphaerochaetaceae bacterium]|nr:LysM peptidoglycan-binding domain-containing protein [Sphaerochaetaceae bacterium]
MSNRERHNYDDMSSFDRHGKDRSRIDSKSLSIIVVVIIIGVVLSLSVILVWYFYFSTPETEKKAVEQTQPLVIDDVKEAPEEIPSQSPQATPTQTDDAAQKLDDVKVDTDSSIAVKDPDNWYTDHTVQEGETLESLSQMYGITKESIISVNAIKSLSSIRAGITLRIPDQNGQLYTVQSGDSLSIITNRYNPGLGWKTLQELNNLKSQDIFPGQKLFIPSATVRDDGSVNDYNRFVSPFDGRITGLYGQTVVYGSSEEIVSLKGLWIAGEKGSEVEASGTGTVVDVGNEIDGMGRFVVLSHENGYRTTYAHLDEVRVEVSQQVKQGEVVGTLGESGDIDEPTLYFSIEQDGIALDPSNFI